MVVGAAVGILAAGGLAVAAPASAGCVNVSIGFFGGGSRCDGPIDEGGNFTRCDRGYGLGIGGSNCYVINVGDRSQPTYIP